MTATGGDFRAAFGTDDFVRAYTDVLVPRLFLPWAEALVAELAPEVGSTAADVACGPGTVTRLLARHVGTTGRVIGADLSRPMLERARAAGDDPDAAPISWEEAPADQLPIADGSMATMTCQQGLQFFPDVDAAAAEWRRVIRPGGRLGVACWCRIEECRPYADLGRALAPAIGADVVDRLRMPFHMGDPASIAALLDRHGFVDITAEVRRRPVVFEGGIDMVWQVIGATPLAPAIAALDDAAAVAACRERLADSLRDITDADGVVHGEMANAVVIARAA